MRSFSYLISRISRIWRFQSNDGSTTILQVRQPILLVAFFIMLGWYIAAPTEVAVMALTTLGGLLLFSSLWAHSMAYKVFCRRRLHYSAFQVGDELEEFVTLVNHSNLPVLWAEFSDWSSIPEYSISSVQAVGSRSSTEWRARTICSRRGVYSIGPWEIKMADPFGIFGIRKVFPQQEEIVVYPPLAVIPRYLVPISNAVGGHRPLRQPIPAETINAIQTRAYIPGDPLRRIHWRTTARHDFPYIKVFEPESSSSVWLVPDLDANVQLGQGNSSTVEIGIILIASLAERLLQERLAVGLFALGGQPQIVLPKRGKAHLWTLLRALARLEVLEKQPFSTVLESARTVVSDQDLLILVTPSVVTDWQHALQPITEIRRPGFTQVVLLDPLSFGGSGEASQLLPALARLGIDATLIRKEDVHPVLGSHGTLRRWEFTAYGTGKVLVRQAPRLAEVMAKQSSLERMSQ